MLRIFQVTLTLLAAVIALSLRCSAQTGDESTVRGVVEKAVLAYQSRNAFGTEDVFEPQIFSELEKSLSIRGDGEPLEFRDCEIQGVKIAGEDAEARLYCRRIESPGGKEISGYALNYFYFALRKTDGKWRCDLMKPSEIEIANALFAAPNIEERRRLIAQSNPQFDVRESVIRLIYRCYVAGDYERANAASDLGDWLAQEFKDENFAARVTLNRGITRMQFGQSAPALNFFLAALEQSRKNRDVSGTARALQEIGNLYFCQNDLSLALDYLQQSLETLRGESEEKNRVTLAISYSLIGDCYLSRQKYAEALEFYQKDWSLQRKYSTRGNPPLSAQMRIAAVFARRGETAAAIAAFRQLLPLSPFIPLSDNSFFNTQLAALYLKQNDLPNAFETAKNAARTSLAAQNPYLITEAYNVLGECYISLGQPDAAEKAFRQAIEAAENQRAAIVGGANMKQMFFAERTAPYQSMVSLLIKANRNKEALAVAEKAKARVLTDILQNNGGHRKTAKFPGFGEDSEKLPAESSTSDLKPPAISENPKTLNSKAIAFPKKTGTGNLTAFAPDSAADLLRDDREALLEYVVTPEQIYLFVLTGKSKSAAPGSADKFLRVYPLGLTMRALDEKVKNFRESLSAVDFDFKPPARELYQLLLQPAQAQLRGKTSLVIIPEGSLWGLPFQSLVTSENNYLIESSAVSYAPSLTALLEMQKTHREYSFTADKTLLAFGNPAIDSQSIYMVNENPAPLSEARAEVLKISRLYPRSVKIFLGKEATELRWKREAGDYRFLHLATHGLADTNEPLSSNLLLSKAENLADGEDGLLEAREIMQLRLHAEMAVLSACETAGGRVSSGEGVIGLSWAFFIAGVPTIVTSQWKVDSAGTADLMSEFYRQIKQQKNSNLPRSKARALQQAAVSLLKQPNTAHPYYWAGFVAIGY